MQRVKEMRGGIKKCEEDREIKYRFMDRSWPIKVLLEWTI